MKSLIGFFILWMLMGSNAHGQNPHAFGFRYNSIREINKYCGTMIEVLDLREGEKVVCIGSANGWAETALAVRLEGVHFILEDIDSAWVDSLELKSLIQWYSTLKGSPLSCSFEQVIGNEKGTGLESDVADKAWLLSSYHHFTDAPSMLQDIRRILVPGGKMFVTENLLKKRKRNSKASPGNCNPSKTELELIREIVREGFVFLKTEKTPGSPTLIFENPEP